MAPMNTWLCGFGMFSSCRHHCTMNFVGTSAFLVTVKLGQRSVSLLVLNVLHQQMINISIRASSEKAAGNRPWMITFSFVSLACMSSTKESCFMTSGYVAIFIIPLKHNSRISTNNYEYFKIESLWMFADCVYGFCTILRIHSDYM